jgi:hypothetical protein
MIDSKSRVRLLASNKKKCRRVKIPFEACHRMVEHCRTLQRQHEFGSFIAGIAKTLGTTRHWKDDNQAINSKNWQRHEADAISSRAGVSLPRFGAISSQPGLVLVHQAPNVHRTGAGTGRRGPSNDCRTTGPDERCGVFRRSNLCPGSRARRTRSARYWRCCRGRGPCWSSSQRTTSYWQ